MGGKQEEGMGEMSDGDQENWMVLLRKAVKRLHFGRWEEKEEAARDIKMLAKQDLRRRKLMVELGVIEPLVDMVGSEVAQRQRVAVQALIHLTSASLTNKAIMVGAGIMSKLPKKVDSLDESTKQEFAQLLLHMTVLATSALSLTSSTIMIRLAVNILDSTTSAATINLCLSTLHNLSLGLDNVGDLVTCGAIKSVLRLCSSKESSEMALTILGNLAVTLMGKKALENTAMVVDTLVEILAWEDKPKCQELSAYILMSLAHQSSTQRDEMAKAGIVPVLLEVALLGSPLAQKRAFKLLQWFKEERRVKMGPHSGPQERRMSIGSLASIQDVGEGTRTYELDVNKFADLTNEEFRATHNGYKQAPFPRSCKATFMYENVTDVPSSMDWRTKGAVTPVKDQGQCGCCWAFSAVAATEGINQLTTGKLVSLSEQELVDCDRSGIDQGCMGGLMDNAFNFIINNHGLTTESNYPYQGIDGTCNKNKESNAAATISGCEDVPENSESSLLKAVANQPISVAIDASGQDFQFYKKGVFTGSCGTGLDHGVTAIGYGTAEDGTKYWLVKNSWGTTWGEKGYIRMQRDVAAKEGLCGIAMEPSYPTAIKC